MSHPGITAYFFSLPPGDQCWRCAPLETQGSRGGGIFTTYQTKNSSAHWMMRTVGTNQKIFPRLRCANQRVPIQKLGQLLDEANREKKLANFPTPSNSPTLSTASSNQKPNNDEYFPTPTSTSVSKTRRAAPRWSRRIRRWYERRWKWRILDLIHPWISSRDRKFLAFSSISKKFH